MKQKNNEVVMVCGILADKARKKIFVAKETVENLHKLNEDSTILYFAYKNLFPDYEEVVVEKLFEPRIVKIAS